MSDEIVVHEASSVDLQASPDTMGGAVVSYLAQLSPSSRRTQAWALQAIVNLVTKRTDVTIYAFPWHQLTPVVVALIKQGLSEYKHTTSNRILAALRGVITSAWRIGLMDAERKERLLDFTPVRGTSLPAGRHIGKDEIRAMKVSVNDKKTVGIRDIAILALLAGTGLRRSEVCSIDLSGYADTDGHGKSVAVTGKGNKQRSVAVPSWVQSSLDAWLEVRGKEEGPLFLPINRAGEPMMRRLSASSVALAVQNAAEIAGIDKHLTTHDFRRTYVSNLLDAGVDLAVVQRLVGHSDPKITARYDRRGKAAERAAAEKVSDPTK